METRNTENNWKKKAKREGNDSLYEMLKQVDPKSTEKFIKIM